MEKTNQERAKELFDKEPNVNTVYITKDGNMFRAEYYARDWAKGANGGEVETIHRGGSVAETANTETGETGTAPATTPIDKTAEGDAADEKAELTKRYIELYDGKPNNLIGVQKLKELIAAKELENLTAEAGKNADETPA